jgi:hypothetical protein
MHVGSVVKHVVAPVLYGWLIAWKHGDSFYCINNDSQVGYVETFGSLVGCGRGATH